MKRIALRDPPCAASRPSRLRRGLAQLARIRYRLLLVNAIVAAVPLVGISFAELHETQLLGALEDDMIHQAELVRAVVLAAPDRTLASFEPVLAAAASDTHTRIRLLDASGAVRADSHRDGPPEGEEAPVPRLLRGEPPHHRVGPPQPLDTASRREVRAALAGRYGSATRLWGNQQRVFLFSALPIRHGPARRDGSPGATTDRSDASVGASGSGASSVDGVGASGRGASGGVDGVVASGGVDGVASGGVVGGVDGDVVYVTKSTHDVKLQLYRLRTWLFRVLAFTLALTSLVTLVLATTIARPLGRLTRRAQRIAARQPVEPDRLAMRSDEIGQLARAVEAMTVELERRARDARTLAADLSHEFKTPLTGIRGAAELLRDGAADDPDTREQFLAMIVDDTARLDRLVSRLLELARVEDDRGAALPVDLAGLARACSAKRWGSPVELAVTGTTVVPGRAPALASAIENLVANAAQHAETGTTVHVVVEGRADSVRVIVANHGPALSPAARIKVWDRFYSTRHADGGSGLGLAIVRSV
ncbi:MAG: histidine kinase dimerization/phospho-acceptor domain-containing protein, partial [Kofleriaceae bacterium]